MPRDVPHDYTSACDSVQIWQTEMVLKLLVPTKLLENEKECVEVLTKCIILPCCRNDTQNTSGGPNAMQVFTTVKESSLADTA